MSFLSKVELKKRLQEMGIKVVEGNYVSKLEIKKILSGVKDTDYPYYRVSNSSQKPTATEDNKRHDPYGVYLFIKGQPIDVSGEWSDKKWRWDAKLKKGVKILDLDKMNASVVSKLFATVGLTTFTAIWDLHKMEKHRGAYDNPEEEIHNFFYPLHPYTDKPTEAELKKAFRPNGNAVYRVLRLLYPTKFKTNKIFSELFIKAGFDALLDTVDAIYPLEPQLIVFNPANVIWGERERNVPDDNVYVV